MTWIISKIVGNPMVLIVLLISAFVAGGSAAWWVQGVRVQDAKTEFRDYKLDIRAQEIDMKDRADQEREAATQQYSYLERKLNDEINAGVVYRRCVAAGKCGARVLKPTSCSASIRLPAISGNDGAGADTIPVGREPATEERAEVVSDCAITTLRLNRLQGEIEGQDGY